MHVVKSESCAETAEKAAQNVIKSVKPSTLLLISGGSSIAVAKKVIYEIKHSDINSVHIALVDERDGHYNHEGSNWQALAAEIPELTTMPHTVVLKNDLDLEQGTKRYNQLLSELFRIYDHSVAILGIGEDGHMAGIMSMDEVDFKLFSSKDYVVGYKAADYDRITITPHCLELVDEIVVYACSDKKKAVIDSLVSQSKPPNQQPAQLLKAYSNVTIYT